MTQPNGHPIPAPQEFSGAPMIVFFPATVHDVEVDLKIRWKSRGGIQSIWQPGRYQWGLPLELALTTVVRAINAGTPSHSVSTRHSIAPCRSWRNGVARPTKRPFVKP